jgi:hypothetical protein
MIYRSALPGGPKGRKLRAKLKKLILDGRKQVDNEDKNAVEKTNAFFVPGQGRREVILQRLAKLREQTSAMND